MIAAHYLDAFRADESADDAQQIEARALEWLQRAGERAAALAATQDARRAFDQAGAIAHDPAERAALLERAGTLAADGDERAMALERLDEARQLYDAEGRTHDAARVAAETSRVLWRLGRIDESIALLEPAFAVLSADEPDADVAMLAAESARVHHFAGNDETAAERVEFALEIAEAQALPTVLSHALNTKALLFPQRLHEARGLLREALDIALEHDLVDAALRAYNNLIVTLYQMDRRDERVTCEIEAVDLARRRGNRNFLIALAGSHSITLMQDGDWDGAVALGEEWLPREPTSQSGQANYALWLAWTALERGNPDEFHRLLALVAPGVDATTSDRQLITVVHFKRMLVAIDDGRPDDLVGATADFVERTVEDFPAPAASGMGVALDVLEETGDVSALLPIVDLIDSTPSGIRPRLMEVDLARARGVAASLAGDHDAAMDWFAKALSAARNLGELLGVAQVLAGYARALVRAGRADEAEPLAAEARESFERMGAVRSLERLDACMPAGVTASA